MKDRITFLLNRAREKLWVKPLVLCVLSIGGAFVARTADYLDLAEFVPDIAAKSIETLLTVISSSMLLIATFAVASMISAYSSASSTATPRSFSLVIADDVSQYALSAFIGAFIFSIVSLIAVQNSYYDKAGRFTLFALTILVFAIVIVTFLRWVDRIARLGRLGTTIDRVETATRIALERRRKAPTLGGAPATRHADPVQTVYSESVGYVQQVDLDRLQALAERSGTRLEVAALPGTFAAPGRALVHVISNSEGAAEIDTVQICKAFRIGGSRTFDDDPRFGFVVLSEIASRALSPGINDPGTAIDVIGTLVRLFALWAEPVPADAARPTRFDRVAVPEILLQDMFDDAFNAVARDGAGTIEVVVRLQKAFQSLSIMHPNMRDAATVHARRALARAEQTLKFSGDLEVARNSAKFALPK